MNRFKLALKNVATASMNIAAASADVLVVTTEVAADVSGGVSSFIKDAPALVKEIVKIPVTVVATVRSEIHGTDYSVEEQKMFDTFPKTMSEATKRGTIAGTRLLTQMTQDQEDNSQNSQGDKKPLVGPVQPA